MLFSATLKQCTRHAKNLSGVTKNPPLKGEAEGGGCIFVYDKLLPVALYFIN